MEAPVKMYQTMKISNGEQTLDIQIYEDGVKFVLDSGVEFFINSIHSWALAGLITENLED